MLHFSLFSFLVRIHRSFILSKFSIYFSLFHAPFLIFQMLIDNRGPLPVKNIVGRYLTRCYRPSDRWPKKEHRWASDRSNSFPYWLYIHAAGFKYGMVLQFMASNTLLCNDSCAPCLFLILYVYMLPDREWYYNWMCCK